jgi:hypothetical protein
MSAPRRELTWWDQQAAGYPDWLVYLHLCCCSCPGLIVGLLFVILCKTPEGKQKGTQIIIYSAIGVGIGIVINLLQAGLQLGTQGGLTP